jgi:hypothetical protein
MTSSLGDCIFIFKISVTVFSPFLNNSRLNRKNAAERETSSSTLTLPVGTSAGTTSITSMTSMTFAEGTSAETQRVVRQMQEKATVLGAAYIGYETFDNCNVPIESVYGLVDMIAKRAPKGIGSFAARKKLQSLLLLVSNLYSLRSTAAAVFKRQPLRVFGPPIAWTTNRRNIDNAWIAEQAQAKTNADRAAVENLSLEGDMEALVKAFKEARKRGNLLLACAPDHRNAETLQKICSITRVYNHTPVNRTRSRCVDGHFPLHRIFPQQHPTEPQYTDAAKHIEYSWSEHLRSRTDATPVSRRISTWSPDLTPRLRRDWGPEGRSAPLHLN